MIKVAIAICTLACISFAAHAEDKLYSKTFSSCMDNSGGVTVEMLD